MSKLLSVRMIATFVVLAGLSAAAVPLPSSAASPVPKLDSGAGVALQILPPVRNGRFFRQTVSAPCNVNRVTLGSNLCVMTFDRVPAAYVLEIKNVNCAGSAGDGFVFVKDLLRIDDAHLLGVLPPSDHIPSMATGHGPFFLNAGEVPRIYTSGSAPTDRALCAIYGTLWRKS